MSRTAALGDVFLIVFGQQRFTAQRNKMYQALDTHTILVGLILHMRFVDGKKNIENRQLCLFKRWRIIVNS